MPESFVLVFVAGVTPSKWVSVWKERMPRQHIDVRPASDAEALAALTSGEADVALLRLPFDDAGLSVIPLYIEKPVVVVPKDHPIEAFEWVAMSDLADETVLDGQDAATIELVAASVGVALMPQSVARALSRKDVVARPVGDGVETQVALAWRADETTPLVEEFIGIVRGRTANSSRGTETPPTPKAPPAAKSAPKKKAVARPKQRRR